MVCMVREYDSSNGELVMVVRGVLVLGRYGSRAFDPSDDASMLLDHTERTGESAGEGRGLLGGWSSLKRITYFIVSFLN